MKIYVCGGRTQSDLVRDEVGSYDIRTDSWADEASHLKEARICASAASFGSIIFIVGGLGSNWDSLNSVEYLDVAVSSPEWKLISCKTMLPRVNPAICLLNDHEVVIMGGHPSVNSEEFISDVTILNT